MSTQIKNIIGLFGTSGDSDWRDTVIQRLKEEDIEFFNPIVDDWTPECAEIEAEHLQSDRVLLFVITKDTSSFGSLAESGWAALSTVGKERTVLFVIEDDPDADENDAVNRARALVRAHAKKAGFKILADVEQATEKAISAYRSTT